MTSDSANAETQAPITMDVSVRACGIGSTNLAAPSVNIGVVASFLYPIEISSKFIP